MGNKLVCINKVKIKSKFKLKSDIINNLVPKSANSNVSLNRSENDSIKSVPSVYSIKYDLDFEDTKSESESLLIEKELNNFDSDDEDDDDDGNDDDDDENADDTQIDSLNAQNIQMPQAKKTKGKMSKSKKTVTKKLGDAYKDTLNAKPFRGQDINEIRKAGVPFVDSVFKANILACVSSGQTQFGKTLMQNFQCQSYNLNELNQRIQWKKPQVSLT